MTSEYMVISQPGQTSYQMFSGDGSELLKTISLGGNQMSYGSAKAQCTYNAQSNNKCLFEDKEYDMGEMCAHKIYAVG